MIGSFSEFNLINESIDGGDCYEANGRKVWSDPKHKGDILYHAEVQGQGRIGDRTFGHAFILRGDVNSGTVFDYSNGRSIEIPAIVYFSIGNIEWIGNYFTYTNKDINKMISKHEHWGPWELKTKW